MSSYLNAGTVAGGTLCAWLMITDEDKSDLHEPRFNWTYQLRGGKNETNRTPWVALWSASRGMSGDSTAPLYALGQDASGAGRFEYQYTVSRGMVRPYFIRGTVKDAGGTPVTGVEVQGFLTGSDIYVGSTFSDGAGNYELPTIYTGSQHYLVAYNAGNGQAGTTVNTLTPSL